MYTNTKAKAFSPVGETTMFDIIAEVLHFGSLSLYYCTPLYDEAGNWWPIRGGRLYSNKRRSRRGKSEMITYLDFPDDITLLSDQIKQAQELLIRVEKECQNVGLGINAKKTKFMAFNTEEETYESEKALRGLSQRIWKSNISRKLKERLFVATMEALTLTKSPEKQLNGCCTRLLRMMFNVHWKEHVTIMKCCMEQW